MKSDNHQNMHIVIMILLIVYPVSIFPENCSQENIKNTEYTNPLKSYSDSITDEMGFLTAANKILNSFDSLPFSIDRKNCSTIRCKYREELIKSLLKKGSKSKSIFNLRQSNSIISDLNLSYYRKYLAIKTVGEPDIRLSNRIKLLSKCDSCLNLSGGFLETNFVKYHDTSSIKPFCEIAILRADLIIKVGCILLKPPLPEGLTYDKSDSYIDNDPYDNAETGINFAIENLEKILNKYKNYKKWDNKGFVLIEDKIKQIESIRYNEDKLDEIGDKALNP